MLRGVIRLIEHSFVLVQIFSFIFILCVIPWFFVQEQKAIFPFLGQWPSHAYTLGIENFKDDIIKHLLPTVAKASFGLLTNEITILADGVSAINHLNKKGISIKKVFYPRPLLSSDNGLSVSESNNAYEFDINYYFLNDHVFSHDLLNGIDVLLIDISDRGADYENNLSLLFNVIDSAAVAHMPIVLLDRPSVSGSKIEGPLIFYTDKQRGFKLPLRHGMTIGEVAQYYNVHILKLKASLYVVPMRDYNRTMDSNIASDDLFYKKIIGTLLAQVRPLEVGVSTNAAYEYIMLPEWQGCSEQEWYQLQMMLKQLGIKSTLSSYLKEDVVYKGLHIHSIDMQHADIFQILLLVLEFFKCVGATLTFSDQFDHDIGTPLVRQYIQGQITKRMFLDTINKDIEHFYRSAFGCFIYYPLPQVSLL